MRNYSILIVEDDPWVRDFITETLLSEGFTNVISAITYNEASVKIKNELPNLIIVDLRLDNSNTGIDLILEARSAYSVEDIPFILISSNIGDDNLDELVETKPLTILSKPLDRNDLLAGVKLSFNRSKELNSDAANTDSALIENSDHFFVKSENSYQKISLSDILYVKGEGAYTRIQKVDGRLVVRALLKEFEFLIKKEGFLKTHRSYIVQLDKIEKIFNKHIELQDQEVPLNKEYREGLLNKIQTVR